MTASAFLLIILRPQAETGGFSPPGLELIITQPFFYDKPDCEDPPADILSVVDRCHQRIDRRMDNVYIHARSPGEASIRFADSHISDRL